MWTASGSIRFDFIDDLATEYAFLRWGEFAASLRWSPLLAFGIAWAGKGLVGADDASKCLGTIWF